MQSSKSVDKHKKLHKTILVLGCVVFLLFALCTSTGIKAYLTDGDTITNSFEVGTSELSLVEASLIKDSDFGGAASDKVRVQNDGSVDCYVRVFAEVERPEMQSQISYTVNTAGGWTEKQADGYYYYKTPLAENGQTAPLFTNVTLTGSEEDFRMIIDAENMQAENLNEWNSYIQ